MYNNQLHESRKHSTLGNIQLETRHIGKIYIYIYTKRLYDRSTCDASRTIGAIVPDLFQQWQSSTKECSHLGLVLEDGIEKETRT